MAMNIERFRSVCLDSAANSCKNSESIGPTHNFVAYTLLTYAYTVNIR